MINSVTFIRTECYLYWQVFHVLLALGVTVQMISQGASKVIHFILHMFFRKVLLFILHLAVIHLACKLYVAFYSSSQLHFHLKVSVNETFSSDQIFFVRVVLLHFLILTIFSLLRIYFEIQKLVTQTSTENWLWI